MTDPERRPRIESVRQGAVRPAGLALFCSVQVGTFCLARPYASAGFRDASGPTGITSVVLGVLVGTVVVYAAVRFDAGRALVRLAFVSVFALAISLSTFVLVGASLPAVAVAAVVAGVLWVRPPRPVRNGVGVLAGASIAAYLGATLDPLSVVVVLAVLSGYDAYGVSRSGHLQELARAIENSTMPAVLTLPERSRTGEEASESARGTWTLGLGDAVLPATLVASVETATASSVPAFGAILDGCCGLVVLSMLAAPGESYAGLPPIAACSIGGTLCGLVVASVPLGGVF